MEKFKKMFLYLLICAAAFYVLPLLGKDTGSFMLILLMLIPLICFKETISTSNLVSRTPVSNIFR
jgi:hypothetical protein